MGRLLDKHIFTNNGRTHSWQKAETRLLTNQLAAPGAVCSRSRTSVTWRGREHDRRTLREQQISGKHWVTSGRDEPQSMSRDLLPRARSNEVWTSLLNYTSCQPLTDQFLSHGPLSLFISFSLSFPLSETLQLYRRATSTVAGMCLPRLLHSYTSLCGVDMGRKSYLSFVVNGCNGCCWYREAEWRICAVQQGYVPELVLRNTAGCLRNF